jgi:hypothetical protein
MPAAPDPAKPGPPPELTALRRCVLAVSVLDGVDAFPDDDGVLLPGLPDLVVRWDEIALAVAGADPDGETARRRTSAWLRLRRRLADLPDPVAASRPVGLPVGHRLHPGSTWVRQRVMGGVLELGTGFAGLLDDPDEVVVVAGEVLSAAGLDDAGWWPRSLSYLEQMGRLAAERHDRDPQGALRPMGDCDVVTLLASVSFREALCRHDPYGLRTAAVPMRRRGWVDLGRIDPAFAVAAAAATPADERGFTRPLLISREEVVLARSGRPAEIELRDPTPAVRPWERRRA